MSARLSSPCPERPELMDAIKRAITAFEALTPKQKREHRRLQRKSWVIGEMMLQYPEMTREHAEALFDRSDC